MCFIEFAAAFFAPVGVITRVLMIISELNEGWETIASAAYSVISLSLALLSPILSIILEITLDEYWLSSWLFFIARAGYVSLSTLIVKFIAARATYAILSDDNFAITPKQAVNNSSGLCEEFCNSSSILVKLDSLTCQSVENNILIGCSLRIGMSGAAIFIYYSLRVSGIFPF